MKVWMNRSSHILLMVASLYIVVNSIIFPIGPIVFPVGYVFTGFLVLLKVPLLASIGVIFVSLYKVYMTFRHGREDEEDTAIPALSKPAMIKAWVFWSICALLFIAGVAFLVCFTNHARYILPEIHYKSLIILVALAAVVADVGCMFHCVTAKGQWIKAVLKGAFVIAAGIVIAAGFYIFIKYIPKYTLDDGCAIVKADPKYASESVEPYYDKMGGSVWYKLEGNPFFDESLLLAAKSNGAVKELIMFDIATGKYEVMMQADGEGKLEWVK